MAKEYEALREELLQWQSRRFNTVSGTIVAVTAILGWIASNAEKWSWEIASLLPLTFLTGTCYLTLLFGRYSSMIGTYLEVFHQNQWEGLSRQFRGQYRFLKLGAAFGLALVYLGLGATSIIVSYIVCPRPPTKLGLTLWTLMATVFVFVLILLAFGSHPRETYVSAWVKMKDRLNSGMPDGPTQPDVSA